MKNLLKAFQKLFSGAADEAPPADAVPGAVATLLAEVARVDHDVKDADLAAAREALQQLFALDPEQADAMLAHALRLENRPTSYHSIVSTLNRSLSMPDKVRLVEFLWRVAHVDREIDMYEDHLVRKISDLLYLSHSDFISARQRAKTGRGP